MTCIRPKYCFYFKITCKYFSFLYLTTYLPLFCDEAKIYINKSSYLCLFLRWDEVQQINRTAFEVNDKTFVFAVELHRMRTDLTLAHLQRAYVCPPEQLQEAIEADRI